MVNFLLDENEIRNLPLEKRYEHCSNVIKTNPDQSMRWDNVWLTGEIVQEIDSDNPLYEKIERLYTWSLLNDKDPVVKHEVCYQIAGHNMRSLIPLLINCALDENQDVLTRHEAIESLGLMRAYETESEIEKIAGSKANEAVVKTAKFVLKRFDRLKKSGMPYIPANDMY